MKKILVIAEKPSAAAEMAKVLHCTQRKNGYIEGEAYIVTWAIGHLVGLKMPEEHHPKYKTWSLETLPFLFPITDSLKILPETANQFAIVKKLIQSPEVAFLINAGDAGREGYLIQSWIYRMAENRKPVKVLWASSLTEEALRKAFSQLKEESDFQNLLQEAEARAEADYLLGMNYSRALTLLKSRGITLSYGRCQTPLLNLIVKRETEISEFIPKSYFQLKAWYQPGFTGQLIEESGTIMTFSQKDKAEQLAMESHKLPAVVQKCDVEHKKKKAPLLFNLAGLQKEMGRIYKYSPDKTLEILQTLYETHKIVSYPRTDSCYLSNDLKNEILAHVTSCRFGAFLPKIDNILPEAYQKADNRYFNDAKVTDHHALIPTIHPSMEQEYQKLTLEERTVFDAIVNRFLAIFYPPYEYSTTTLWIQIGDYTYKSKGITIQKLGYKEVLQEKQEPEEESFEKIPLLQEGETVSLDKLEVVSKKTKAPPRYTVESVIALMEKYHIGTPATMASILLKLQNPKLQSIYEEKGTYYPTVFGQRFIGVVPEPLKSPTLTLEVEEKLQQIGEGNYSKEAFLQELLQQVQKDIAFLKEDPSNVIEKEAIATCPICKGNILEQRYSYFCTSCAFQVPKILCKKNITIKLLQELVTKGRTGPLKGFLNKNQRSFTARLKVDAEEKKIVFDFTK